MSKFTTKRLLYYFLRGLLVLVPIALTVYIIIVTLAWIDSLVPATIPGLGLIIVTAVIVMIGYLASSFIAGPAFDLIEELIMRVPFISIIYSSVKDLLAAFVGDKKKFNQPVLVEMEPGSQLYKVGFITQDDMGVMGHADKVAVYLPHSYNFSGNLFILPKTRVTLLNLPSSDIMKFIVSGGISGYPELLLAEEHARNQQENHAEGVVDDTKQLAVER